MNNTSGPPSLNFDFSSLNLSNNAPSSPVPFNSMSYPMNSLSQETNTNSQNTSTSPYNSFSSENSSMPQDNNQANQALTSVQQRMEQMKQNQQNLKRLQEERKRAEERKLEQKKLEDQKNEQTRRDQENQQRQWERNVEHSPPPSQSSQSSQLPQELLNSMTNFMNNVDAKLQAMENQLRKLTLDFQQSCNKQEQNTEALSKRLNLLKNQLEDTRSSVSNASSPTFGMSSYPKLSPEPPAMSSPFTPPSATPSFSPPPAHRQSQEEIDAEIAKKLQEEFDNEQKQADVQRSQMTQSAPPAAMPQAPIYQQTPPTYQQPIVNQEVKKEACPVCGLSFNVGKELIEHADSHFEQSHTPQQRQQIMQQMQMQANTPKQNDEPGFFAKIFGAKPKQPDVRPPVYYTSGPPPQQQQQPPQQVQQPQQPPQSRPQPIAYYQTPNGQPVYIGPNGQPVWPQQQQPPRF